MSKLQSFIQNILANRRIDDHQVNQICDLLELDNVIDLDDVKLLVDLYISADQRSASFEHLFFGVLKKVILADGEISLSEQFYLLKMLYSDRVIRSRELDFLRELKREARVVTPEFEALCETAFQASPNSWDVGGTASSPGTFVPRS